MEAKRKSLLDIEKKRMKAKRREEEADRKHFTYRIDQMEEDEKEFGKTAKVLPRPSIVKHREFMEKLWGWDRLVPKGNSVEWSDYNAYLEEYHRRNLNVVRSISAPAETCMNNEKQLVSVWNLGMKSQNKISLPIRKSIILSCLINERARSVISTAGGSLSDVLDAALLCITKEGILTRELLRRGADPVDDYFIDQGREICLCALSLTNCPLDNTVAAFAALLGMAKEAEMMCSWMIKNDKIIDIYDDLIPDEIVNSRRIRYRTLNLMINIILEQASSDPAVSKIDKDEPASRNDPSGFGDGIAADGAANTTGVGLSDVVLDSQYKINIKVGERSKSKKEDIVETLWGWERLQPLYDFKWSDYSSYLEEYYIRNADKFVAAAAANQSHEDSQIATNTADMGPAVAKFCLKMEEELLSKWEIRVRKNMDDTFPVSTFILSSLIKELALPICGAGDELCLPSAVAFVCMSREADLICELLNHGAKPFDDIVQQSSVIRMCALGLVNLKGKQSFAPAAAMLGTANEAKKMCDWMKRENKLVTFSLSEPHELEECRLIRIKALDVITSILHESSFPGAQ